MSPSVLKALHEVVLRMDSEKPTTAAVKAAELILNRAHGVPVLETERALLGLSERRVVVRFNMRETEDGPVLLELEPPAPPPRDADIEVGAEEELEQ